MEYRNVGTSGLKVSAISLGGWTTFGGSIQDRKLAREIIETALEGGVNFFDEADAYARGESEKMVGEVLRDHNRDHLVISSKVYWPMSDDPNDRGLSRKHLVQSIDGSLKRLGTDYLDLYFCHRHDPSVPMEEIVQTMSDLVARGKTLYWGTSEWPAEKVQEAVDVARKYGLRPPVVEQPQYSLVHRERVEGSLLPVTTRNGIGLVVWSPLGMGLLTGKYDDARPEGARLTRDEGNANQFLTEENIRRVRALKPLADEWGVTRGTLALAWVLRQPGVSSAIVGATKVEQMRQNLQAADFRLSGEQLAQLDAAWNGA
ncbi:MAG TPA: aldo/keto reductase family protein [Deinococcales bacterium]|nr:aldo/keto reductase family protein [Deinococcales bacterium]